MLVTASHRYQSRRQAELEACEFSREHDCSVVIRKLPDGRYENDTERRPAGDGGCDELALFASGAQRF